MSNEMLQKTIDLVSSLEAKNEAQQVAKYELIEYTKRLHKENQELKKQLSNSHQIKMKRLQQENKKLKQQLSNSHQMKNQQKVFIQWLENKMNETHYTMFEFQAYRLAFEKYKEIIGVNGN